MTTETILTLVVLAWLATGLGLGYLWSRDHIRANKAEQREGLLKATLDVVTAHADDLRAELERAETGRKNAEKEAAAFLREISDLRARKGQLVIALANTNAAMQDALRVIDAHNIHSERTFWLPDIDGNKADLLDIIGLGQPIGLPLSFDAEREPIGAGVGVALAEVVQIGGAR